MKTKTATTAAFLLIIAGTSALAQDMSTTPNPYPAPASPGSAPTDVYRASELSLEGFALGTVNEYTLDHLSGQRIEHHGRLGLGAGLDYFFIKYVGVEVEAFSESTHHSFVDDLGGNLVLRLPIGNTGLAPYAFGGGGHLFDPAPGSYADGGAGLEYRFTPVIGLFGDARFVTTDRIGNYGMGRLGIRFSF